MNRRQALRTIGAGFPALLTPQAARRPNVIFMMTDDQRWDAMSCAGNRILKTPNLDRLAAGGVRFTEAFATNPLCSPSRGTILTGLHTHAHGVTTNEGASHRFKPGVVTYPQLLQQAGYYSAMIGKWHIATLPEGLGFDHWSILPGQGVYHDPVLLVNRGNGRVKFRGWVDDVIMDNALETLASRPKDKPFSLICNFKSPHRAWEPPARHEKALENVNIPTPSTFHTGLDDRPSGIRNTDMQIADMPDFRQRGVPPDLPRDIRKVMNHQTFMKNYYRVLMGVDDNVGRLLDYLDGNGLADNTIIVYTGDNGFFQGEYGMFDKRLMYEPSIRVPMLLRYPNAVKAGQVDTGHMVLNNDVAHTILDYCGLRRPAHMEHHGESWRPLLDGSSRAWRESWMYEYMEYPGAHCAPKARGVRTRTQKLIHYIQQPQAHEFFDLATDPEERRSLYDDPARKSDVARLAKELERWRTLTNDDRREDGTPTQPCGSRGRNG